MPRLFELLPSCVGSTCPLLPQSAISQVTGQKSRAFWPTAAPFLMVALGGRRAEKPLEWKLMWLLACQITHVFVAWLKRLIFQ
jgi:hypothetical protein